MRKMNKKTFIFIILLTIVTYLTYSRYVSQGSLFLPTKVAAWSVKINGRDVSSSSSFTLDNLKWSQNNNVAENYAAPGGEGYYEVKIDTSGTKVAIDYTIGIEKTLIEENTRMRIKKITFDNEEVTSENGYYDGFIPLKDVENNKVITIKIFITWVENYNDTDDFSDVESVLNYGKIELPLFVTVRQHIDNTDLKKIQISQLIPYKETLLEVPRPTQGIIIEPYYDASLDSLYQNPERGMYSTNFLVMSKSGNTIKDMEAKVSKLLYLKVDLSAFSAWRNGKDEELTQDVINTLQAQLNKIKQHNNTVILRFVYDNNSTGIYNDNKTKFEPQQTILLKHIQQLKPVFQEYSSTIFTIQIGFYGLWGESFYNTDVNSHPEYYQQTMEALLDATANTEITIAFRTPSYAKSAIQNSSYDTSRIGIFNDAYLSQNDDMGTYVNRQAEIEWLNSRNTSYGGEALPATFTDTTETTFAYEKYRQDGSINNYIDSLKSKKSNWDLIEYTEDEMYKTHTSYINFEWNQYKHYIWSNLTYNGKNELYHGKTALEYVQSHLGYRLVLKNVEMPREATSQEKINASITIENVGFGNVLKSKSATLLFVDSNNSVKGTTNITNVFDIKSFKSESKVKKSITFKLPNLTPGTYKLYLRISNNEILSNGTYYCAIRLANNNIWNESLQANRIGAIKIT